MQTLHLIDSNKSISFICAQTIISCFNQMYNVSRQLPWWLSGKESACQSRRHWFSPWVGKIPWRGKWQPTPVVLPGKCHGQSSLVGYGPWGHRRVGCNLAIKQQKKTIYYRTASTIGLELITPRCTEVSKRGMFQGRRPFPKELHPSGIRKEESLSPSSRNPYFPSQE